MSFDDAVAKHRRELRAHCYRMLGSAADADDALQEALLAAWKGFDSFEGRSSLRTWLYRVTTNACLRHASQRKTRLLSMDRAPACASTADLGAPIFDDEWLEPLADDDAAGAQEFIERKESVELAFVAALQHLPPSQRAALVLCETLDFSAADAADMMETSTSSVNSALQRARAKLVGLHPHAQRDALAALGEPGRRELVAKLVRAWESADAGALVGLLSDDVRFSMPPLPAWFDGRDAVMRFFTERVFADAWRLVPLTANDGQLGFACYTGPRDGPGPLSLGAVNVLSLTADGRVAWIAGFLDPKVHARFGLPAQIPRSITDPHR